jgi:hypothetical protein
MATATTATPSPLADWPETAVRGLVVADEHGAHRRITVHEDGIVDIDGAGRHRIVEAVALAELRGAYAAGRAGRI